MDEKQNSVSDIAEIKKTLISWLSWATKDGPEKLNVVDLKETADAIKDLAEAEKECREAEYYKAVVEAMESGDDVPAYIESMRGRMGSHPVPGMGYSNVRYQGAWNDRDSGTYIPANDFSNSMRMDNPRENDPDANRYGQAFSEYRKARRHYTETHAQSDKRDMDAMAQNHLMNTIATFKEMWSNADPEMKSRMKADLSKLVNEMNV